MRRSQFFFACCLLILPASYGCQSQPDEMATLILTGGIIHSSPETAEAIAIGKNGTILAVGSVSQIASYRAPSTAVIELAGDSVLPGLQDRHVHPTGAGLRQKQCMFPQGSDLQVIQSTVAKCIAESDAGEWIRGGQWDAGPLGGVPTKAMLDAVSPDNPVVLGDTSGHSTWANSRAMELSGITRDTQNPPGGIVERDSHGEPTGVFRESASRLVRSQGPGTSFEEQKKALAWALQRLLSFGITSLTDAGVNKASARAYAELADEGVLKQRVRLCFRVSPEDEILNSLETYSRDRVFPDCIKIMLDGVPTDSHTAAMLEPYAGTSESDTAAWKTGLLQVPSEELNRRLIEYDRRGLTVKIHAAGDAAVRAGLDAIEAARKANGPSGLRHNVGHITFISEKDIPRARDLGATYEVSPYLWSPTPINDAITAAAGPERIKRVWAVREMLESGALVVPGSDWSVIPSPNPWLAIESLVTREVPGGGASFGKSESITLEQALQLFTVNAAQQLGQQGITGRIEPGAVADLIVINHNPFEMAPTELHKILVQKTIINGEVVYSR